MIKDRNDVLVGEIHAKTLRCSRRPPAEDRSLKHIYAEIITRETLKFRPLHLLQNNE